MKRKKVISRGGLLISADFSLRSVTILPPQIRLRSAERASSPSDDPPWLGLCANQMKATWRWKANCLEIVRNLIKKKLRRGKQRSGSSHLWVLSTMAMICFFVTDSSLKLDCSLYWMMMKAPRAVDSIIQFLLLSTTIIESGAGWSIFIRFWRWCRAESEPECGSQRFNAISAFRAYLALPCLWWNPRREWRSSGLWFDVSSKCVY